MGVTVSAHITGRTVVEYLLQVLVRNGQNWVQKKDHRIARK